MMEAYKKILVFLFSFYVYCCSYAQNDISGINSGLLYLSKFGYIDPAVINPKSEALLDENFIRDAIKEFQAFAGINVTGIMDEETIIMMNTPRCGVKDKVGYGSNARKKRYALQGSRWKVRDLSYRVTKYPNGLTKKEVDADINNAFKVWEKVTDLTFTNAKSGKIHIEIRFERGEHGDGDAFDGRGGTLAHAYFPIYGGDAHFDASERWTVNKYSGTNLFQVAAHEFGHSLGLSHSDVEDSLMAPFYRGYRKYFSLDVDDVTAIQALYGEKQVRNSGPRTTPNPVKPKPNVPGLDSELCGGGFDTILNIEGKTYVFKGDLHWQLTKDSIAEGYPKKNSVVFKGLPSNLDAAFTWSNNNTYYFKGSKYYRFKNTVMDSGYPRDISKGFQGIPNNVDVAFIWGGNGKIYFFKDQQYWKFDPTKRPPVSSRYPKDISTWEGLPNQLDAALKYTNGYTYFFKKGKYWRFNDRLFATDENINDPYPRDVGPWWFGCSSSSSQVDAPINGDDVNIDYGDVSDDTFNGATYSNYFYEDNYVHPRGQSYYRSSADSVGQLVHGTCFIVPILTRLLL